tara:strand:- start:190 stop:423 length:234 start_codon:yes stop_codon:yes gene_type:complete
MKKCAKDAIESNSVCNRQECRLWMNYDKDLNCAAVSIKKYGRLGLKEVGERLGISYVRVSQIEKEAFKKLKKKNFEL